MGLGVDWICPLARLSDLEKDFRAVASQIIEEAIKRESWEHGRTFAPDRVAKYVTKDDVENVLKKRLLARKMRASPSSAVVRSSREGLEDNDKASSSDIASRWPSAASPAQTSSSQDIAGISFSGFGPTVQDFFRRRSGTETRRLEENAPPSLDPEIMEVMDSSRIAETTPQTLSKSSHQASTKTNLPPNAKEIEEAPLYIQGEGDGNPQANIDTNTVNQDSTTIIIKLEALGEAIDSLHAAISRFSEDIKNPPLNTQKSPRKYLVNKSRINFGVSSESMTNGDMN